MRESFAHRGGGWLELGRYLPTSEYHSSLSEILGSVGTCIQVAMLEGLPYVPSDGVTKSIYTSELPVSHLT